MREAMCKAMCMHTEALGSSPYLVSASDAVIRWSPGLCTSQLTEAGVQSAVQYDLGMKIKGENEVYEH